MDALLVIFGVTGDLSKRKLIPAAYKILKDKRAEIAIAGVGRSESSIGEIFDEARRFAGDIDASAWNTLRDRSRYIRMDFEKSDDYERLRIGLEAIESDLGLSGNRIYYFATPAEAFDSVTHNLKKYGVVRNSRKSFSRIVFEKPFGHDLESAKRLNDCINRIFSEKQIYRIDHYLGKELVGNIALMRFTNRVLEPLWNSRHIASVQMIMAEEIGVEGRGKYYDSYGAIKDVVQNHALQLLALVAMESPKMLTGEHIRQEKARVLKKTVVTDSIVAQYDGYIAERGVKPESLTETFVALKLEIDSKRWKGVPFYIKAGKALSKRDVSIHVKFKDVECRLARSCPSDSNYFDIRIQPDEGFSLELNAKQPGEKEIVMPVTMDFSHSRLNANTPEAYETLIEDVIRGDQSIFVRNDEILYSWAIVDKIKKSALYKYKRGTIGPEEMREWNTKNRIKWRG